MMSSSDKSCLHLQKSSTSINNNLEKCCESHSLQDGTKYLEQDSNKSLVFVNGLHLNFPSQIFHILENTGYIF